MNKIKFFFDTLKPRSVVVGVSLSALLSHQYSAPAVKPHNRGLNQGIGSESATMEVVPLVTASSSSVQTGTVPTLHQAVINGNNVSSGLYSL